MATVLSISTAHNDKGVALFDKDYTGNFNIVLDEFTIKLDINLSNLAFCMTLSRTRQIRQTIHLPIKNLSSENITLRP